ncbi:hypothetical protein M4I21_06760 [Cellulophaga sp. 20_2_10]|uniref:Imm52 family immunity protein n=1 Tax=Cellulophaga sp. 20_2_10 TaxID=2942476 RepID=UPI00201A7E47|nr:Imm52 family immunity protein [Cellulophaga sp. 20_2_10]MCL5245502.1 hypothetical protein [Cellulophaga sp. 20_2_10]
MILIEDIGVSWYNRRETLKECTESFIIFMERLKLLDSRFDIWYKKGWSKKEALEQKIPLEYDAIKNEICKTCKDDEYPEHSFRIALWNGAKKDSEAFGIRASLGREETNFGNNNCSLSFPYEGEIYEHYLIKENKEKLKELFIDHWQPEKIMGDDGKWINL